MLPREWAPNARAPYGKLLVRRDDSVAMVMGLFIPESYRKRTRSATAVVLDRHPACRSVADAGDDVLLAAGSGKELIFGLHGGDEEEVWVIDPHSILCRLDRHIETEDAGEHVLRNAKSFHARLPTTEDGRWDEGDPEGLR